MRTYQRVRCERFPCSDVRHAGYIVPGADVKPGRVSMILISEAAPAAPNDYYYARGNPLFAQTTIQAFNDAGVRVASIKDILDLGVYFTTAVKCAKTGYGIQTGTVKECSRLLEQELALFPNARAYLLMGDVAIKAINSIAARAGEARVIPGLVRPTKFADRNISGAASACSHPICKQAPVSSSRKANAR